MDKGHYKGQMSDREAMKLALEALDSCEFDYDNEERQVRTFDALLVNKAHRALHQALEQPEREWVGLTQREIIDLRNMINWMTDWSYGTFAYAIEQKLKEKNGG